MIVKCIVPMCKEIGEGVPGRPYACARHARWLVPSLRGLQSVAKAAVVEAGKQVRKEVKMPWWVTAFVEGAKGER
jgi:hypothetical protein